MTSQKFLTKINYVNLSFLMSKRINLLMYADDIVLLCHKSTGLHQSLNLLHSYSKRWNLNVDTNKTKILILNCIKTSKFDFTLGND